MKWDSVTPEELPAVNDFLKKEPLELETGCSFKRYARRQGESDKMVHFESDVPLRLLRVDATSAVGFTGSRDGFYLTLYEPRQKLFMKLNDGDFHALFSAESRELLGSTMLWAIKQANKSELNDGDDPEFGAYS